MTDLGLSMLCSHFRFPLQKKMEQKEKKTLQERSSGEGETSAERVGRESVSDR